MDKNVIVSTGEVKFDYEIIGPVYFQVSNKPEGFSESAMTGIRQQYEQRVKELKQSVKIDPDTADSEDWELLFGDWSLQQSQFEIAFFIAVEEIKKQVIMLGGDGVIFMRHDLDLDKEAFQYFYLQMYGTAVKAK